MTSAGLARLHQVALRVLLPLGLLGACSPVELIPSPHYDGTYRGQRVSDSAENCGISTPNGQTSALIARGHLTLPLFGPQSVLEGTVSEDGRVRADGYTPELPRRFPQMTVLTGRIDNEILRGEADNFGCHTQLDLHKIAPVSTKPAASPKPSPKSSHLPKK